MYDIYLFLFNDIFYKEYPFIFSTYAHNFDSDKNRLDDWILKGNIFHIIEKFLF